MLCPMKNGKWQMGNGKFDCFQTGKTPLSNRVKQFVNSEFSIFHRSFVFCHWLGMPNEKWQMGNSIASRLERLFHQIA
jgi:hypothetical protein